MDSVRLVAIFAWHVLAACVLFVAICFGAIGLNLFTEWMSSIGMPIYITRLIPLSQVGQYLGLAGQIQNGAGFEFFGS